MKKISIVFLLSLIVFIPFIASASFDKSLYYGLQNDSQIRELQEFLTDQGVYSGPITGNFFSLTLKAVKQFQSQQDLPQTGYFGVLSRQKANEILVAGTAEANQEAIQETGTIIPPVETPKTTNDVVNSLQSQIALLLQQIALLQSQMTTLNQIQQNTQQIAQNTCVQNWQCTTWNTCENSKQTRTCTDSNNCGVATNKPAETQSCSSLPTAEEKSLKDYKIKYLGFVPLDVAATPLFKIDYYKVSFIVDTIVPIKNIRLKLSVRQNVNGNLLTKEILEQRWNKDVSPNDATVAHNYTGEEILFEMLPSQWGTYSIDIFINEELKSNEAGELKWMAEVNNTSKLVIEIPQPPTFNNFEEEIAWINTQGDTRLEECEEYREKQFESLKDCL